MKEGQPKPNKEILFVGHLEDVDDLKSYGRDGPLEKSEKNREDLNKIVDAIITKIKESSKEALILVASNKIRAQETAHLVGEEIKKRLGEIKVRYAAEENLNSNDQGEFNLPEDYTPGLFFEGLSIASKIFLKESLENNNLHYKFGDPLKQAGDSYKYPELANYFKASGETYAEALIRIFSSVVEMSQKVDKLDSSVEVILVSHGFNFHILRGLTVLAEQIKNGSIDMNEGEIAGKIWEIYKQDTTDFKPLAYVPLDITNLGDEQLISMLSREIERLKK
mgnify:CR=1 FL=1